MTSPTQLTLKMARTAGFVAQVVEKWNAFAKIRIDLFRVIDIVAIKEDLTVGIQATSGSHHAERKKKILGEPLALLWIKAGNELWLTSWTKKKNRWEPRLEVINQNDFNLTAVAVNND